MSFRKRLETFPARVRTGAALWIGTLQFFVVEAVVQSRWPTHYDRRNYYISDLGALHCSRASDGRFVCSPWHALMNASFVAQGALIAGGALLLHHVWAISSTRWQASTATALLASAGVGIALVGLAPEDTVHAVHAAGAAANFAAGNAGLLMLLFVGRGASRPLPLLSGVWAGVLGAVGLAALASFLTGSYWGLGVGGIERVIAYPVPAALPVVAIGVLLATGRGRTLPGLESGFRRRQGARG